MPTDTESFETIQNWEHWDAEHRRMTPTTDTAMKTGPLRALHTTHELIESLTAGRWHMITAARLGGATWDEIARAMNYERGSDALRDEYAGLVDWYTEHPSIAVNVNRWRAAVGIEG